MTERQPYSTAKILNVAPTQDTNLKLSGGKTIPYVYSLGVNSTSPYVKLLGSSMGQKLFTWTEEIIVPAGEMVTVVNGSYHPGDIWIQSGADWAALPARVTVPVNVVESGGVTTPEFNIDTRRARRAFVQGMPIISVGIDFTATGAARDRSHAIDPALVEVGTPTFSTTFAIPPGSPGLLPLGDDARAGDGVHALLDVGSWSYDGLFESSTPSGAVYYVLEYL